MFLFCSKCKNQCFLEGFSRFFGGDKQKLPKCVAALWLKYAVIYNDLDTFCISKLDYHFCSKWGPRKPQRAPRDLQMELHSPPWTSRWSFRDPQGPPDGASGDFRGTRWSFLFGGRQLAWPLQPQEGPEISQRPPDGASHSPGGPRRTSEAPEMAPGTGTPGLSPKLADSQLKCDELQQRKI